jgi:Zn-dependent peptidase ImmA (M78 family)
LDFGFVENFVLEIFRRYQTRDVFALAERANVKIVYESWHPTTRGEFERKTKTIRVNRRALLATESNAAEAERKIVAHELGHFFALDLKLSKTEEEKFARAFAECLVENEE